MLCSKLEVFKLTESDKHSRLRTLFISGHYTLIFSTHVMYDSAIDPSTFPVATALQNQHGSDYQSWRPEPVLTCRCVSVTGFTEGQDKRNPAVNLLRNFRFFGSIL